MLNAQEKSRKILYIITQGNWGGAQRYVFDLATRLCPAYQVIVASGKEGEELQEKLTNYKVRYVRLPHLRRAINPWHDILALKEIYHLVKSEQPAIVHLNSSKAGVIGSAAAKLAGTPKIIFTMHGLVLNEPLPFLTKIVYFFAEKISSYFKDAIIAVSYADKSAALSYHLKKEKKIKVIHNGIDRSKLSFYSPLEAKLRLSEMLNSDLNRKTLVGTIADFYPTKGLRYLVEAARSPLFQNQDITFLIIGRYGPDYENIVNSIRQYGLETKFYVITNLLQATSYLKAFDAFVFPSVKEGFPYTILEAAAAEIPIVASSVGGIPEILDGDSSFLIPPAEPGSLAQAIKFLLDNPQEAKKMAAQAALKIKRFSIEKMIEETKRVYEASPS